MRIEDFYGVIIPVDNIKCLGKSFQVTTVKDEYFETKETILKCDSLLDIIRVKLTNKNTIIEYKSEKVKYVGKRIVENCRGYLMNVSVYDFINRFGSHECYNNAITIAEGKLVCEANYTRKVGNSFEFSDGYTVVNIPSFDVEVKVREKFNTHTPFNLYVDDDSKLIACFSNAFPDMGKFLTTDVDELGYHFDITHFGKELSGDKYE